MWFSHVSSPLGPRVRTNYNFILDVIEDRDLSVINKLSNIFTLRRLDLSIVDDVMKASYVDPDIIDVVKSSVGGKKIPILASYYEL